MIQMRQIKAGDVGDGERAWGGVNKQSFVSVQPIKTISILTGTGKLSRFTGFRPDHPEFKPVMAEYIAMYQQLASADAPATIVEIHRGVPIVRQGVVVTGPAASSVSAEESVAEESRRRQRRDLEAELFGDSESSRDGDEKHDDDDDEEMDEQHDEEMVDLSADFELYCAGGSAGGRPPAEPGVGVDLEDTLDRVGDRVRRQLSFNTR
jgi:hypothetical protein